MVCKNKYYKFSKISEAKFRHLIRCFAQDLNATDSAAITELSVRSVNDIFLKIRVHIADFCEQASPIVARIEIDDSLCGTKPIDYGATPETENKAIVFGIFKRNGKVFTEIVPDCSRHLLKKVIRGRAAIDTVLQSDNWRGYHDVVDINYAKLLHVKSETNELENIGDHSDTAELFWSAARRRLKKFNGVPKHTFYLHLKETEFRFNHQQENLYKKLLGLLRNNPI